MTTQKELQQSLKVFCNHKRKQVKALGILPPNLILITTLAKILPEKVEFNNFYKELVSKAGFSITETELLHFCQLARKQHNIKSNLTADASWQEQVVELVNELKTIKIYDES